MESSAARYKMLRRAQRMINYSFVGIMRSFHARCEFGGHSTVSLYVCMYVFMYVCPSYFKPRMVEDILMKFNKNAVQLLATPNSCP